MKIFKSAIFCAFALSSAFLSGCLSDILAPTADTTVFYMVKAMPSEKKYENRFWVNLQSIQIPQYMTRTQIVSCGQGDKLEISEFDRWAELPANGIERAIAVNVESTGVATVFTYPSVAPASEKTCSLKIYLYECLGKLDSDVVLAGKWQLDMPDKKGATVKSFKFTVSAQNGYDGYVEAINKLLAQLSAQIADSLAGSNK